MGYGSEIIPPLDFESATYLYVAVLSVWTIAYIFSASISFLLNR